MSAAERPRLLANPLRAEWREGEEPLRHGWQAHSELLASSGAHPTFNGLDWLFAQHQAYTQPGERLKSLWLYQGSRLVGFLALVIEAERVGRVFRRARLLGDGSFDSDYLEPLLAPDLRREAALALVDGLRAQTAADYAILRTLPSQSASTVALLEACLTRRVLVRHEQRSAGVARLHPHFEETLAALKPRMRSKVRQALRRAEEAGFVHRRPVQGEPLAPWLEALFRLHQARWQALGEPGAFADPRRRALYTAAFARFAELGCVAIDCLEGPDGPIAIQAGFNADGTYHQLQEGYDPALEALRPGVALRALALRAAIEGGIRRYDFLGGFSSHKRDWGAEEAALSTITLPLGTWKGRALVKYLIHRANSTPSPAATAEAEDGAGS